MPVLPMKTNPRPRVPRLFSVHLTPRGGHPEACCMAGGGGALRPGLHPGLGRLREPPWAYYGACARSSLEGSGYPKPDAERVTRR